MTADEFEGRVQKLIDDARAADMSDEMMIDVLHDLAEALRERLSVAADRAGGP